MATDKSEPRIGLIFRIGITAVVVLAVTRAALASYFDEITQGEEHRKVVEAKPAALLDLRSDEQKRLSEGPLPIAQAMHDLAAKGRMAASRDIAPVQSKDLSPLQGWMRMPAVVPVPMTSAESSSVPADGGSASPPSGAVPASSAPALVPTPTVGGRSTRAASGAPLSAPSTAPAAPKKKP